MAEQGPVTRSVLSVSGTPLSPAPAKKLFFFCISGWEHISCLWFSFSDFFVARRLTVADVDDKRTCLCRKHQNTFFQWKFTTASKSFSTHYSFRKENIIHHDTRKSKLARTIRVRSTCLISLSISLSIHRTNNKAKRETLHGLLAVGCNQDPTV